MMIVVSKHRGFLALLLLSGVLFTGMVRFNATTTTTSSSKSTAAIIQPSVRVKKAKTNNSLLRQQGKAEEEATTTTTEIGSEGVFVVTEATEAVTTQEATTATPEAAADATEPPPPLTTTTNITSTDVPVVQFVFVAGLEGTGHELSGNLVQQSPAHERLAEWDVVNTINQLQVTFQKKLWAAHCAGRPHQFPLPESFAEAVQLMRDIQARIMANTDTAEDASSSSSAVASLPVTILLGLYPKKVSYPYGFDNCRKLRYPNLDLLQRACQEAGVACGMALLNRDPYAILASNQRRKFTKYIVAAMHLYQSMDIIIMQQLTSFQQQQHDEENSWKSIGTFGCWNLLDNTTDDQVSNDQDGGASTSRIQRKDVNDSLGRALGFTDLTEWDNFRESMVHLKPPMTDDARQELVPAKFRLYMDSWVKTHRQLWELCQQQERNGLQWQRDE